MNSMDRINQLLELPKEEFNAEVHKKPFSFFKDLKALPDDKANIVYEVSLLNYLVVQQYTYKYLQY